MSQDHVIERRDETRTEASVDDVYEIIRSFAEGVLAANVSNECYADHQGGYVHLFVGGYPADGFSDDHARSIVERLKEIAEPLGWFVAKAEIVVADDSPSRAIEIEDGLVDEEDEPQTMLFIDLFPAEGTRCENSLHQPFFWHASPSANRSSILENGIEPRTCGNDHITLPEGRIYACVHAMFLERVEIDMGRSRNWTGLDLWRIDMSRIPDHRWRMDVEMDGISSWTDIAIPPHAIEWCGTLEGTHSGGWRRLDRLDPSGIEAVA